MHIQRVVTNESCNQHCVFCNACRPVERAEFVAQSAVVRRIDDARSGGAREIILTGGEPTLRRDIAVLVRHAGGGGARVVIETNAALIDDERARDLAAAGLGLARVQLVAWGAAADAITQDPGGFDAALTGIRALAAAGVTVEVTVPVVRRNLALLAVLPEAIDAAKLPVAGMVLVVPLSAPDPAELASLADVAEAMRSIAGAARRVGLAVRLDSATFVPPCISDKPSQIAHLYALNRGNASRPGYEHVADCAACLVNDRCPGLPRTALADDPSPRLHPIVEPGLRRRLTVVSTIEDQIARELVGRDELRHGEFARATETTVRINFHCNQACEFCFVSTHLPPAAETAVRSAIETAAGERSIVVLSGGEPTLNPRVVEYVHLARQRGAMAVELQTNAIRLANPSLTQALADAGLDRAMVSLHGSTAEISDAVTSAPGTFALTVLGIDELRKAGIRVRLNFVFCQANRDDFPAFIALAAERWPGIAIVFSFVGSHTDVVPRATTLIPRFSDILASLVAGLERARAAGLDVTGFDSMCGLPLCLVPESERGAFSEMPVGDASGEFVKAEGCARCDESWRCHGVRRGYAELYGTSELRAIVRTNELGEGDGLQPATRNARSTARSRP